MKSFKLALCAAVIFGASQIAFAQDNNSASGVSPAERTKIEGVVHDYLKAKPEVILESVQALQQKQMNQMQQTIKDTQTLAPKYANQLLNAKGDAVAGNPQGTVTIVEFFDYQCPHCVDMAPIMDSFIKKNKDVRVIYKEWPIRGPLSQTAAQFAMAANLQGKYYEFHHAVMMAGQLNSEDQLLAIAKSVGLDLQKLKSDMAGDAVQSKLKETFDLAQSLKLFGTPAFFVAKTPAANHAVTKITYVPGIMNENQLKEIVSKA